MISLYRCLWWKQINSAFNNELKFVREIAPGTLFAPIITLADLTQKLQFDGMTYSENA